MKYSILLWHSGQVLLTLWKFFFNILSQQQHINMQIRYKHKNLFGDLKKHPIDFAYLMSIHAI